MNPWLETIGVIGLTGAGGGLGWVFSRLPRPWWFLGYILPLILVGMIGACGWIVRLNFLPPFSWVSYGRTKFVLIAFAAFLLALTLLPRLSRRRVRVEFLIFVGIFVANYSILPFLEPGLVRHELENLKPHFDHNGVCMQTTDYTCGPAAAVTALRKLGFPAEEGQLAILAHTCPAAGTSADSLCEAMMNLYGPQGLVCTCQSFNSLWELKALCPVVVQINYSLMVDHFVTVLEVRNKLILIGDPLFGTTLITHEEFNNIWRFLGISLERKAAHRPAVQTGSQSPAPSR